MRNNASAPLTNVNRILRFTGDPHRPEYAMGAFAALCEKRFHLLADRLALASSSRQLLVAEQSTGTLFQAARGAAQSARRASLARHYGGFLAAHGLTCQSGIDLATHLRHALPDWRGPRAATLDRIVFLHDMIHILLGYGRENLGEACVLALTARQLSLPALSAWAWRVAVTGPGARLGTLRRRASAVREATQIADRMVWLLDRDWQRLLHEDTGTVRRALAIPYPAAYEAAQSRDTQTARIAAPMALPAAFAG